MLRPVYAMSNNERQHRFRERHPEYAVKYNAQRRALRAAAKPQLAEMHELLRAAAVDRLKRTVLALPAPAELPIIPGMNTIAAMPALEAHAVQARAA
jgi:hypothetical protein